MVDKTVSKRKSNANAKDKPSVPGKRKFYLNMQCMLKLMLDTLFEYKSLLEYRKRDFNLNTSKHHTHKNNAI